jgi:methyl-accepting chemotaxis protein
MQMDEMTQSNASLVEEAAAASEAMGAQAEELTSLVSYFKLNESISGPVENQEEKNEVPEIEETPVSTALPRHEGAGQNKAGHEHAADPDEDGDWKDF